METAPWPERYPVRIRQHGVRGVELISHGAHQWHKRERDSILRDHETLMAGELKY